MRTGTMSRISPGACINKSCAAPPTLLGPSRRSASASATRVLLRLRRSSEKQKLGQGGFGPRVLRPPRGRQGGRREAAQHRIAAGGAGVPERGQPLPRPAPQPR